VTGIHASFSADGTSTDYNGTSLSMNAVPTASQTAVYGNLTFGIGLGSNNIPSSNVKTYPLSSNGTLVTTFGNPVTTFGSAFIDSGSNGIFFDVPITNKSIATCLIGGSTWYCPKSPPPPLSESALIKGATGSTTSPNIPFTIGSADQMLGQNGVFALPQLAGTFGKSGTFDWGLPFFFGQTVYVGIQGLSSEELGTGPYDAF
jgi:hypothetical protein